MLACFLLLPTVAYAEEFLLIINNLPKCQEAQRSNPNVFIFEGENDICLIPVTRVTETTPVNPTPDPDPTPDPECTVTVWNNCTGNAGWG